MKIFFIIAVLNVSACSQKEYWKDEGYMIETVKAEECRMQSIRNMVDLKVKKFRYCREVILNYRQIETWKSGIISEETQKELVLGDEVD